jgi:hypothetical protein
MLAENLKGRDHLDMGSGRHLFSLTDPGFLGTVNILTEGLRPNVNRRVRNEG